MSSTTIACADCGHHRRGPRNTRYCRVCRLLRDLDFWINGSPARCHACSERFPGIRRGDPYCGKCAPGSSRSVGHCAICKTDDAYLEHSEVAVCVRCFRDRAKQPQILRGLRAKQQHRKDNAPPPPEDTPDG